MDDGVAMDDTREYNLEQAKRKVKAMSKPSGLAKAMCEVMSRVSYVQKDKQMMGGGSYKYVSVEAVIDSLRPAMVDVGLILLPVAVEPLTIESFEGKNGGRMNRTQVKYTFAMLHGESGEQMPVVVIGEAIDVGDKSSNKAMTAARKYALIMAFNIETGIDPDDTPSTSQERARPQPPALASDPDLDTIRKLILDTGTSIDRFLSWADIDDLKKLPANKVKAAIDLLNSKKASVK